LVAGNITADVLQTAITEHQRQSDCIRLLQSHYNQATSEIEMMRREMQSLRMEIAHIREGNHAATANATSAGPPPPSASRTQFSDPFANSRTELPPLRSLGEGMTGAPESMTGVQYEGRHVNGYREPRY
jgi:phage shock protein A